MTELIKVKLQYQNVAYVNFDLQELEPFTVALNPPTIEDFLAFDYFHNFEFL
ncbi:22540_t:CDS:1 [Gigaspora rosea]|nr:22540_t:CDS:1 [Gigaspora rosea]